MESAAYDDAATQAAGSDGGEGARRVIAAVLRFILVALLLWAYFYFTAVVPDVSGLSVEEATVVLEDAGFTVGDVRDGAAVAEATGIVEQDADAGRRTWKGAGIDLYLPMGQSGLVLVTDSAAASTEEPDAKEPYTFTMPVEEAEEAEEPEGDYVPGPLVRGASVPLVMGQSESSARAELADSGYGVRVEYGRSTAGVPEGQVYYQDPAPDSTESRGTTVEIWVSTGPPIEGTPYDKPGG